MELKSYARILRQRWRLILVPFVAAAVIAMLTAPDTEDAAATPAVSTYTATSTLITSPTQAVDTTPVSLATVALYATTGEIPKAAARELDYRGEPQLLASMVTVTPNAETGTLTVSATDTDAQAVEELVNAFARSTVSYFRDQQVELDRERAAVLEDQVADTTKQLQQARNELGTSGNPVVEAKISALQARYATQFGELTELDTGETTDLLTVLQPGVAIPAETATFAPPSNPWTRGGIAALLGLLLGAALALVVERLDSRMRTREQVEDTIGLPVLAEIPLMAKRQRTGVVSADRPASSVAEAFRGLRSSVLLLSPSLSGTSSQRGRRGSIVVMVTSAMPGAGKSTTVANLAAVMAEAGRTVLVLSLDLRNPSIHRYFGVPDGTGISELLAADRGRHLAQVVHETDVAGVSIVTSGHDTDHPGALLASVGPLVEAARSIAEVVIIDVPPMLTVSDALDVARHADVTLLVSRLNKTTQSQAEECQRLFKRMGVSALGTVLVGSRPAGARYGYPVVAPADAAHHDPHASADAEDAGTGAAGQDPAAAGRTSTESRPRDKD